MTVLKPAANDIVLGSKMLLADVSDTVGSVAFDFRTGAVNEFTVPIVDVDRTLLRRGLLREGNTLTYQGVPYQIAAIERDYRGDDVWLTLTCRSRLARRLRNMTGPNEWKDTTATAVITSLVKKSGGVAVVEPGAKLKKLVQKRNQTVLDLIAAIASDTGVEWVELDGTLYVGTPWWAYQGKTKLPLWATDIRGLSRNGPRGSNMLETVAFSSRSSLDDRQAAAEASLTVTSESGSLVRPWHRVALTGADDTDNGEWLVSGVTWDDLSPGVQLSLTRPLKSSPKDGSTGNDGGNGNGDGDLPDLGPIEGSSYRDAKRPANWRGRSVSGMVSLFKNNPNGLGHPIYRGCLWYAQEVAGYNHYGDHPKDLIDNVLGSRLIRSKTVVPGAVMLFSNSSIGHAVAYIGGGRCIGTDMDSSGRFTPYRWAIASVDAMERSFGVSFTGWYAPP